jgi:hypothetical protein
MIETKDQPVDDRPSEPSKQEWRAPTLTVLGTARSLTAAGPSPGLDGTTHS